MKKVKGDWGMGVKEEEIKVGLCGWSWCQRLCPRAQHCPLGQARARYLLGRQRQQREVRHLISELPVAKTLRDLTEAELEEFACRVAKNLRQEWRRDILETKVLGAAGSFDAFQQELRRENARLFAETVALKAWHLAQVLALPAGKELKALPAASPVLYLPAPKGIRRHNGHLVDLETGAIVQPSFDAGWHTGHPCDEADSKRDQAKLDRVYARQAARYQRWEDRSSLPRWGNILLWWLKGGK